MRQSKPLGKYAFRSSFSNKHSRPIKESTKHSAILVTRQTGGIGDMLMITPTIRQIKQDNPNVLLIVCTTKHYGTRGDLFGILANNPYIDKVIPPEELIKYSFQKFYNLGTGKEVQIESGTNKNRIDIFAELAGVELKDKQTVYEVFESEKDWAQKWVSNYVQKGRKRLVGIQIHTSTTKRNWPEEKSLLLALKIVNTWNDISVLLFYEGLVKAKEENYPNVYIVSKFSIRQVAALINECEVVVVPDSGLLHVAGALGKKMVALFGSIPPEARICYYPKAVGITLHYPCQYCWYNPCKNKLKCITDISVDMVFDKLTEVLGGEENENVSKDIFIKDYDGLGDILMLAISVKALNEKGYEVDVLTRFPEVFKNLSYGRIVKKTEAVSPVSYKKYFDLSNKLSDYEKDYCCQHRIKATAYLCGLSDVGDRPEILLDESEIEKGNVLVGGSSGKKVLLGLESADDRRDYPKDKTQTLINAIKKAFPKFKVLIVGDEAGLKLSKCVDLRGKTNVRELFSVVFACDYVVCVDSAILHIAGAFKKPTILLPSTVPGRWRKYDETVLLNPPVECWPCTDRNKDCRNKKEPGWCIGKVGAKAIVEALRKISR